MKILPLLEAVNEATDYMDFSDLEGDLDADTVQKPEVPTIAALEDCSKCHGKGYKVFGYNNPRQMPCFGCNGTGKVKPGTGKRREAFKRGLETKATNLKDKKAAWVAANPEAAAWIVAKSPTFQFAASMGSALETYGSLTDKQLATVSGLVEKDKIRKAEYAEKDKANQADLGDGAYKILEALNKAFGSGVSRPRMRTGVIDFSLAPPNGNNPGNVYVKASGEYVGKITPQGIFSPSRDCPPEIKEQVIEVAKDPLAAAVMHGKRTGTCSCCGRKLDNKISIELGIGPICREKYF